MTCLLRLILQGLTCTLCRVQNSELARNRLDDRLKTIPSPGDLARPHKGWIRAIRDALGMSASELASRVGVRQQTISEIERSEQHDTIRLKTLESVAQAMNCQLVYALIPDTTLEEILMNQARHRAIQHLEAISQHSRLEDQAVSNKELADQIEELAVLLAGRRGLWTEEPVASQ